MSLLEGAGAQVRNPSRGKPIHIARIETGLFTNRSPLHDPASWYVSKYGGYPDALIDGSNMEVSNQLTMIRRPGLSQWSTITVPDQPNWFYDWRTLDQGVKVVVDTITSTYIQSSTAQSLIFTKSIGAGQGQYQGVGDTLYYGDGVDLQKYVLPSGTSWNWGIVAPASAPSVTVTESVSSAVNWAASTWFSTMGIIIDANGNAQQLVSVNANPLSPNATQFGTSGNGAPNWSSVSPGGTLTDGTVTWTNRGPIGAWTGNFTFAGIGSFGVAGQPAMIWDPTSKGFYGNSFNTPKVSGAVQPPFTGAVGDQHFDNQCNWVCYANSVTTPQVFQWQKNHAYTNFLSTFNQTSLIIEPFVPPFGTGRTSFIFTSSAGTSQATPYAPPFSATPGFATIDGQLQWISLGSATWQANHSYSGWSASNNTSFNAVKDPDGNLHVCTKTGTSGSSLPWQSWQSGHLYATLVNIIDTNGYIQTVTTGGTSGGAHPAWNTTVGGTTADNTATWTNQGTAYGFHTTDGTAIWTCVGTAAGALWAANQSYYLPVTGFSPPSAGNPFGSAAITDSNNSVEFVVNTGLSKTAPHPVWNVTTGGLTIDNTVTWRNNGAFTANSLVVTKGHVWAYSYKARSLDDFYSVNVTGTSQPPIPPGANPAIPLPPPTGSKTGAVSTASPVLAINGPNAGAIYTVSGIGSTDLQVDTIVIWRDLDGGGAAAMFELTEIPAPPPINGIAQPWTFQDFLPDTAINEFISAPINHQNDPPPAGFLPMAFHFERIWGKVGNFVFASGGPDVLTGNPNEAFSPDDFFEFPSPVTRIVPTATGILVFLTSHVYGILGGPIFSTFFPTPLVPGVGLLHYNALDVHGAVIYLYTADNQFISMDPSGGAQRMGGPIADKLALFDATKAFVTVHESGNDNAIFVSDGTTGWYRLNPSQFPNGAAVWSPKATVASGTGAVMSIEVTTGVRRLLVGGIGSNTSILQRDFSTYLDNGFGYTCGFTMGSINLVSPGQIAGLTFVNLRATRVGTSPICSFLLNEISGTFTTFPQAQAYPWQIYGATLQPLSLFSNAYYFRAAGVPALAEHMQVQVSFPPENFANEVLSLTIFGTIEQPPEE